MNNIVKKSLPHIAALLVFLVMAVVYFLPQTQGKVMQQGDVIQYRGMTQEILEFQEQTGEKPLWTNSMFGGMPSYQINTPNKGNYLSFLDKILRFSIEHPIGRFLAAMISFYILMVVLGVNHWLAAVGAIAFGFTTNNFTLYEAGHITKLRAISFFPLVAAGMLLAYRRQYIWGGLIFAAGFGLNLLANHVQMTYYLFLTLPFFAIAELIKDYREKQLPHFFKATAVLAVGGLLAIGASAANLWTTYEYSRETMRGKPILEEEATPAPTAQIASSSATEGLAIEYAFQWSNGVIDLFASFIPGAAGGGSSEKIAKGDAVYQDLLSKGINNPGDYAAPLYWGALPFTSGPIYFGAVIFFLFIMGLILVKGPVKWWIGLGALLTLMLSMGNNLMWFNEFFYNYVPLYNKWRTPNSVLAITSFLLPVLGMLTVSRIVKQEISAPEILRSLYMAAGIVGGVSLIMALIGPSMFSFSNPGDARLEQSGWSIEAIVSDRKALLRSDALRSFLLVLLSGGLIWAFVQKKIRRIHLFAGLAILVTFDLWMIDRRYVDYDSFESKNEVEAVFQPRPVDQQILQNEAPADGKGVQDPAMNYRVFDITESAFQSARYAYYHKMIGGYHAAKLQRYQDIIDRHLINGNQNVINMLNTRYFIVRGNEGQPAAQQNPGALGNAWFVDAIQIVNSPNEEIDALTDFRPDSVAIVNAEFSDYVQGLDPGRSGSIELTDYRPDDLVYQSNNANESLAVFSEVWYGPNKGWQAYIDGEPVDHIRVNYVLRGLRIPAGQHEIRFNFHPKSFYAGRTISRISSSLILLGLLGFIGFTGYHKLEEWKKEEPVEEKKPEKRTVERPRNKTAKRQQGGKKRKG